jgi:hypothetical protein
VRFICYSGHDWPADDERFVAEIYEWFWCTDNSAIPVQLGLETAELRCVTVGGLSQRGTGIV